MKRRVVEAELLDGLPPDDPAAVRSRADLRRINRLMGNERWVLATLAGFPRQVEQGVCEWGAGDGGLALRIARRFAGCRVIAHDLAPRPAFPPDLAPRIDWRQGDILAGNVDRGEAAGVLVANLFLHHFEGEALRALGARCEDFGLLVFNEPDRAAMPLRLGRLLFPFVHPVTRHDMRVSILAGFRQGEMPRQLGLDPMKWTVRESSTWRGARRVIASRA